MIKSLPLIALSVLMSTDPAQAVDLHSKPATFPFEKVRRRLGANIRTVGAAKWPNVIHDAATGDRIVYNVSRYTGGFIRGENHGRSWNVEIDDHLDFSGVDLNGSHWRYDAPAVCESYAGPSLCDIGSPHRLSARVRSPDIGGHIFRLSRPRRHHGRPRHYNIATAQSCIDLRLAGTDAEVISFG